MKEVHIRNIERVRRTSIASIACSFKSEINAIIDGKKYNAKSIMNMTIIDNAENIDFFIHGFDEEMAAENIRRIYN